MQRSYVKLIKGISKPRLIRDARSQAAPYHVVGIFSGVGEKILLSVCEQLVRFLGLELLELLHLPAPLGALHPLLRGETEV